MTDDLFYIYDDDSRGKALILREGLRLFAQKGLSDTSIRDIAAATKISNPALYKHFKTKHDLALVLFERLYREHLRRLTIATKQEPDFDGKFRAFIRVYLSSYDEHPHATMFTTDNFATLWPDLPAEMKNRTVLTLLREMLEQGKDDGSVTSKEQSDLQLSLVIGMLGQVTRQLYLRTLTGPAVKHVDAVERLLRSGLT